MCLAFASGCGRIEYGTYLEDAAVDVARSLDASMDGSITSDVGRADARGDDARADAPLDAGPRVVTLTADMLAEGANLGDEAASDGTRFAFTAMQSGGRVVVLAPDSSGRFVRELDTAPVHTALGFDIAIADDELFVSNWQAQTVERWTRTGATWRHVEDLADPETEALDFFGRSIAACDGHLFVGATGRDVGGTADRGRVSVFRGPPWSLVDRFEPSGAGRDFGRYVVCGGDRVVVMDGYERAVTYTNEEGTWTLNGLIAPFPGESACSLAIDPSGQTLAVGYCSEPDTRSLGRVLVHEWIGATWSAPTVLMAEPRLEGSAFGDALALAGDTLLVGASGLNVAGGPADGAVHQFRRVEASWEPVDVVVPTSGSEGRMGSSVVIASGHGGAGAPYTPSGGLDRSGAVIVWPLVGAP